MNEQPDLFPARFEVASGRLKPWEDRRDQVLSRLKYAASKNIRPLIALEPHHGKCVIVGAGPTVKDFVNDIRGLSLNGAMICSLNGAHNWLIKKGIIPNIHIIFEDDIDHIEISLGGQPHPDVTYYVCSHCNQRVFDQLEGFKKVLWHANFEPQEYQDAIANLFPEQFMIGAGYVTFFRTLVIGVTLGFRNFDLYGVDCSFEGSSHIDEYKGADLEPPVNIWGVDARTNALRKFNSNGSLSFLAHEFLRFCQAYQEHLSLRVHGDNLLRYIHESRYPDQYTVVMKKLDKGVLGQLKGF